jgi:hypothetical protein
MPARKTALRSKKGRGVDKKKKKKKKRARHCTGRRTRSSRQI